MHGLNSTPDQVKTKINDLGMTDTEAVAKANSLGIDLQKYPGIQSGSKQTTEIQPQVIKEQAVKRTVSDTFAIRQIPYSIPGFEGRSVPTSPASGAASDANLCVKLPQQVGRVHRLREDFKVVPVGAGPREQIRRATLP